MTDNTSAHKSDTWKQSLRQAGITGMAYGFGLLLGNIISILVFRILPMTYIRSLETQLDIILTGIVLALLIVAIGSGFGGFIGGWTLPRVGEGKSKRTYAWRSAVSTGVFYSPTVFLGVFAISLIGFYYVNTTPASIFTTIFLIIGALFGLLFGLLLGLLTLNWRGSGWVVLASTIGFGIGGAGLGYGVWAYMLSIVNGDFGTGSIWMLLIGLLWFGLAGGSALGFTYHRLAVIAARTEAPLQRSWFTYVGCAGIILIGIFTIYALRQVLTAAQDLLTSRSANLSPIITSETVGTHWSDPAEIPGGLDLSGQAGEPMIGANPSGGLAIVWSSGTGEAADIVFTPGQWQEQIKAASLSQPLVIPGDYTASGDPYVAIDQNGGAHIIWRAGENVLYSACRSSECGEPQPLPDVSDQTCVQSASGQVSNEELENDRPVIAEKGGDLMAVWLDKSGALVYTNWQVDDGPENGIKGCVQGNPGGAHPSIDRTSSVDNPYALVYQQDGSEIFSAQFENEGWVTQQIGLGSLPKVQIDTAGQAHYAWCSEDDGVVYLAEGETEQVSTLPCKSRPELGVDSQGRTHIVWHSDLVKDIYDTERTSPVLYESIRNPEGWTEASIIAELKGTSQPALASNPDGVLHLAWSGNKAGDNSINYASQVQYDCEDYPLTGAALAMYEITRSEEYRDPDAIVPYCQNRYDRLLFTPYPMPEFSDEPALPHGGFDDFNEMMQEAQYEVLLSTMEYDEDQDGDSPGMLLAEAITELYHKVEANPEDYPRGMTVRVLLGNPPRIDLNSDLWRILGNLRAAGLPDMENPDIGWKLEVANFEGSFPHSHIKILIIDGITAVSTGFNYQYHHYPEDHPSGRGEGTVDIGIQVTGPAAQEVQTAFDDLWDGATQRHCESLDKSNITWQFTCRDSKAVPNHVPEVKRYYLSGGDAVVFSMLRSEVLLLSDNMVQASIAHAQDSLDVVQAMFAMPPVCMLNFMFDLCTFDQAMPYIDGIMQAAENGAEVRLLLKMTPVLGTEALVALQIMADELEVRGLEDQIEIRAFPIALHAKTFLIDDELVIIGSQNFHYTAFGEGLAEHNLGVLDPEAAADYKRVFDYYWDIAGEEIVTK